MLRNPFLPFPSPASRKKSLPPCRSHLLRSVSVTRMCKAHPPKTSPCKTPATLASPSAVLPRLVPVSVTLVFHQEFRSLLTSKSLFRFGSVHRRVALPLAQCPS